MNETHTKLEIKSLKIPFKQSFKHLSAERSETQTVIVIASDGALKGYGEACPREYVTNESVQSALRFFDKLKDELQSEVISLESLKEYHNKHRLIISRNPSAWCAIELAYLDLFAKKQACSIEKLLGLAELEGSFNYTAVIGDGPLEMFEKTAAQYIQMGFRDFKIKISGDPTVDFPKLELLKSLGAGICKIRLDANNLWNNIDEVIAYLKEIPVQLSGLEEPLKEKGLSRLRSLAAEIDVPIILDESFNQLEQFSELGGQQQDFIINLRVSKMGGLINSLAIADEARKQNMDLIIGAQVGETSILTRAALCVANFSKGYYKAMEGAFGTFLLEHDIVEAPLMFGQAGRLEPKLALHDGNGFQLDIKDELIH